MNRVRQTVLLLCLGTCTGLFASCVLEDVPLDQLQCPCAEGWQCLDGICVLGDFVCGRSNEEPGSVALLDFRTEWTTPNQARFAWDVENAEELFEYELDVSSDAASLITNPGERIVTLENNPEFARGFLEGTSDSDVVDRTTLRELEPNTPYFVRLVARDNAGGVSCSSPVSVRTSASPSGPSAVLFADEHASRQTIPGCMELVDDVETSASGSSHYAWDTLCRLLCPEEDGVRPEECGDTPRVSVPVCPGVSGAEAPGCYENLRIQDFNAAFALSAGQYRGAYFEMWVAIEESDIGGWGELGLRTAEGFRYHALRNMTFVADGEYHRYQVPLANMTPEVPATSVVTVARFGTSLRTGTRIRVDDISIRW